MIVTLQQARDHLQATHSTDDDDLNLKIEAASQAIVTYLKVADEASIPAAAQAAAKAACLMLIGEFYLNREAEQGGAVDSQFGYGYLPRPVVALLYPHRDPSIA